MTTNQQYFDLLKKIECADATGALPPGGKPIVLARGKGSHVWDVEGRRYIDLCAGFGSVSLGHNPEEIVKLFAEYQASEPKIFQGMGDVYPTDAKIAFLEYMLTLLPKRFEKLSLSLSGSGAIDTAIKSAILSTKSAGFISFEGGYHGLELGLLPTVSRHDFRDPFDDWFGGTTRKLPWNCNARMIDQAIGELSKAGVGFAGIILEPVQGRGGTRLPDAGWLQMICDRAHAQGGLVIFDEIFTGMGRSGVLAWAETYPCDILCLGKGLGGGVPISLVAGTNQAMQGWPSDKSESIHTGTFFGHPFSCEIAHQVTRTIVDQDLVTRSKILGEQAKNYLLGRLDSGCFQEVRQCGLMIAIETNAAGGGATLMESLKAEGVIAIPSGDHGQVLALTPALNIPEVILEHALDSVISCVNRS